MTTSGDSWSSGATYDAYMGRWSRSLARVFVEWLHTKPSGHWLDVGCGTGALTSSICENCEPASVLACDPAEPFVAHAQRSVADTRASFVVAGADALPARQSGFDVIVSGLVLNFLPDAGHAVAAMRERVRPGGIVAAYVWDYESGLQFLRHFWDEAAASDPNASGFDEGGRFPLCQPAALASTFRASGLESVDTASLEIPTSFADFDDFWNPFLGGTGPAPSYVASLDPTRRESLKERLRRRILPGGDGPIQLRARAWAVRGVVDSLGRR
jgi:SAM-dependent methyltransferase